jgi:hypothetical protein
VYRRTVQTTLKASYTERYASLRKPLDLDLADLRH